MTTAPLLVEATRGDQVESRHEVDAVVATADGTMLESWGDPDRLVLPRSAVKPVQALPLVTTGAADAFGLGPVELALSCSSHDGEPDHVVALSGWLARIGCSVDDLACGILVALRAHYFNQFYQFRCHLMYSAGLSSAFFCTP